MPDLLMSPGLRFPQPFSRQWTASCLQLGHNRNNAAAQGTSDAILQLGAALAQLQPRLVNLVRDAVLRVEFRRSEYSRNLILGNCILGAASLTQ